MSRAYAIKLTLAVTVAVVACILAGWQLFHVSDSGHVTECVSAETFLNEWDKDHDYGMQGPPTAEAVRNKLAEFEAASPGVTNELLKLARTDAPARAKAVNFFGRLQDFRSVEILVSALHSQWSEVRLIACRRLQALSLAGFDISAAREKFIELRRGDESIDVRGAAASTLKEPGHQDAIVAFKQGLGSSNVFIREECEEELEKQGKLELPLPEHVYEAVEYSRYERVRDRPSWRERLEREVRKNGKIYFEEVFHPAHSSPVRRWYRTDDPAAKGELK